MSTGKQADWADIIMAESDLPADEFTWTEGSNYGLDGFHHDQTLGEGTRNNGDLKGMAGPVTPPQARGMSALPDGLVGKSAEEDDLGLSFVDDEGDFDLSQMLSPEEGGLHMTAAERRAASLADLAWLDPTQEQDPERLPKELRPDRPPLHSLPELEEAWGVNRRTDGLALVPNKDKEVADYEQSIESGLPATPGVEKNAHDIAWHIKKAVRLSHYGKSVDDIYGYLTANLSRNAADKAFNVIAAEHGLAGNVFIRASAFPGLKNGKWAKEIKRRCRSAKYVITDDPAVAAKLGRQMVREVNYRKALRHYLPQLQAAGYRVASVEDDPKKTLQLAFLTGPKEAEVRHTPKPVHVHAHERVSLDEAKQAFASAPKPKREAIVKDDTAKARKAALALVKKAVNAGLISAEDATKLAASKASPANIRRAAEKLARANLAPKTAVYGGLGTQVTEHRQASRDAAWAQLRQAELDQAARKKALAHVNKMVEAGQLTRKEAAKAAAEATPEMVLKVATAYANANSQRKTKLAASKPAKQYGGPQYEAAPMQRVATKQLSASEKVMREASAASGIKVAEFRSMARWVRQKMSEGMAGDDLTELLKLRFASPLRTAGEAIVAMLRDEHEGLAGHLYVDAEAYASKTGSKGCEKAASTHRANQIPFVRAMPRCAGCTLVNAAGTCTKYGKKLLAELPADAAEYKRQMIQMADAPDHEITASLFNPSEFNLDGSMNVELEEPAVTEDIGDVLFGDGLVI